MFRITKNATMQDKIVVSILLKHITIPTLSLPRVVKFCNAQRIGILKTKTRQKLQKRVSFVFPNPNKSAMTAAFIPRGTHPPSDS